MKHDVFISYSRKDSEIASRICDILDSQDPKISYFIDKKGIGGGNDFPEVLANALADSSVILFLASKNSYASDYTMKEVSYTISKKGSTCIIPLIIDDSQLPPGLELQLSNINWRVLGPSYTLESNLVDDLRNKLKDPSAGETFEHRKRKKDRKILFGAIGVVCAILIYVIFTFGKYNSAKSDALADSDAVKALVAQADSLISHAAGIADPHNAEVSLEKELQALDLAAQYADEALGIMTPYEGSEYKPYFTADPASLLQVVNAKKDSIFYSWSDRANDAYDFYKRTGSEVEKGLAARFADDALKVRPDDEEMNTLKSMIAD